MHENNNNGRKKIKKKITTAIILYVPLLRENSKETDKGL